MAYPNLVPTSRSFSPGDFANKKFSAQDGAEFRILYGDKRVGMTLQLTYANITDQEAELFLDHYHEMKGTYTTFIFTDSNTKGGWGGNVDAIGVSSWGSQWRYDSPPQVQSVYPGVSTVTVNLKAATI